MTPEHIAIIVLALVLVIVIAGIVIKKVGIKKIIKALKFCDKKKS